MKKLLILLSITGLMCLPYACGDREEMLPGVPDEWQAETVQTTAPVLNADAAFFGTEEFSRTTGAPNVYTRDLQREDFEGFLAPFILKVVNGDAGGDLKTRVSAAMISLDGVVVLDTADFSKNMAGMELEVEVLSGSVLTVELMGQPGSYITLDIEAAYDPFCGDAGTITDERDGEEYDWVRIGEQIWMAENLRATTYNDGTAIPLVTGGITWTGLSTPAYCWYNNDQSQYAATYGALYNWYTVNTGKLCPTGWDVPSDEEWKILEMHLGMSQTEANSSGWRGTDQGNRLKETGTTHWRSPSVGTNSSGFTGVPGGYRHYVSGGFHSMGNDGNWWSSTAYGDYVAWYRALYVDLAYVLRSRYNKRGGFSVRCLRD